MSPAANEPPIPTSIVCHRVIGSLPGRASRANAPTIRPPTASAMRYPSIPGTYPPAVGCSLESSVPDPQAHLPAHTGRVLVVHPDEDTVEARMADPHRLAIPRRRRAVVGQRAALR